MLVGSVEGCEGYLCWLEVWKGVNGKLKVWKGMKDICVGWKCGKV